MDILQKMRWIICFLKRLLKRDNMRYLYKYTPHNAEYKYDIITKPQLWFSKVENFNDPIDSQLDYSQQYTSDEILQYWKNFLKNKPNHQQSIDEILQKWGENSSFIEQQNRVYLQQKSQMGVLCFSVNPKNILMWSHYANNHKGIVYEFKANLFTHAKTTSFQAFPFKIEYPCSKGYQLLSYTKTGEERNKQFVKELTIKSPEWAYEEEYRMIDLENSGNKKFNHTSLNSIIFGARTSIDEIDAIKCLCKRHGLNHIKFKKAKFIEGRFELEFIDI